MPLHHFDTQTLPDTPWKNGGGSTRELLCWPHGANFEQFDWRVSIATIDRAGPFSVFDGVDRHIMLLAGDGVHLQGPGVDHVMRAPHQPFAFRGELPIQCQLLGGRSTDFNVMSRRARGAAQLQVLNGPTALKPSAHGVLLCLHGAWQASTQRLLPGQGLWWADEDMAWALQPAAEDAKAPSALPALVAVQWISSQL